jgi:hypothetical protein
MGVPQPENNLSPVRCHHSLQGMLHIPSAAGRIEHPKVREKRSASGRSIQQVPQIPAGLSSRMVHCELSVSQQGITSASAVITDPNLLHAATETCLEPPVLLVSSCRLRS